MAYPLESKDTLVPPLDELAQGEIMSSLYCLVDIYTQVGSYYTAS